MFLKCDSYRVWCSIFYSKLVNCILLRSLFVFVKGRGTCGSGERNDKICIKSPRFSLTSSLSQEREKSSHPVFTMCGEPWTRHSMWSFGVETNLCRFYIVYLCWYTCMYLLLEIKLSRGKGWDDNRFNPATHLFLFEARHGFPQHHLP